MNIKKRRELIKGLKIYKKQINKQRRKRERGRNKMELELYWFDKNWKQRGEGRNAHLIIDYNRRTYRYFTSYTLNGYNYNAVQVERKGDLSDYMQQLDAEGFICSN